MASVPVSAVRTSSHNKGDSVVLPQFMALRSLNQPKFAGYRKEPEHLGFVWFEQDDIWSPYVKLQVVKDKESGFISIRCCYNNKLWRRYDAAHWWIVAGEDSPNTNPSTALCTLFDFSYDATDKILSLRHVESATSALHCRVGGDVDAGEDSGWMKFVIHDMDTMVRLPKHVTFKGNNGKYLRDASSSTPLLFDGSDVADENVVHTVRYRADGNITLSCKKPRGGKSWYLLPGTIHIHTSSDSASVFQPVEVGYRTVALRCLENALYCKRFTNGYTDGFSTLLDNIDECARLVVAEPVISRRVYSVEYDLHSAYIYDLEPLLLDRARATNDTADASTLGVRLSYSVASTKSWNNSVTVTAGIETTVSTGIPFIVNGEITVSASASYTHEWGGEMTEEKTAETTYNVTVPVGKSVVVDAVATQGKCDVKFSYVQKDVLSNGDVVESVLSDGVFRGMNAFNFDYHSYYEEK